MKLSEGPRQVAAGGIASAVFLALFFGMDLIWWLALVLGAIAYGAALLLIERKAPLSEIHLTARVTAADVAQAATALEEAGNRLEQSALSAPTPAESEALTRMTGHLRSIRQSVIEDPDDFRASRQFINVYLPKIVQTVETYVKVSDQATDANTERLERLGDRIRGFEPVIHRIRTACIDNDLTALELEVDVLSKSLDRR